MNNVSKIIKYIAIAFAIFLIAGIATSIITVMATFYGISSLIDTANNSVEVESFTKEYENIYDIEIDVSSINLEIVSIDEADTNMLKILGTDIPTEYKFEQENGILKIKGKKIKQNSKLVMYVPATFKDLDIDIGAGNILIDNITIQKFNLDTGATNTNIKQLTVSSDADIDAGAGDITIENSNITNLDMDSGVGKLEYTGYLTGINNIDCGVGNLELNLQGTESIYKITAQKGVGDLKINGNKLGGTQTVGSGTNIVNISGGVGSLDINY